MIVGAILVLGYEKLLSVFVAYLLLLRKRIDSKFTGASSLTQSGVELPKPTEPVVR